MQNEHPQQPPFGYVHNFKNLNAPIITSSFSVRAKKTETNKTVIEKHWCKVVLELLLMMFKNFEISSAPSGCHTELASFHNWHRVGTILWKATRLRWAWATSGGLQPLYHCDDPEGTSAVSLSIYTVFLAIIYIIIIGNVKNAMAIIGIAATNSVNYYFFIWQIIMFRKLIKLSTFMCTHKIFKISSSGNITRLYEIKGLFYHPFALHCTFVNAYNFLKASCATKHLRFENMALKRTYVRVYSGRQ